MKDMSWIEMMKKAQEIRLFTSLQIKRAQKGGITSAQELDLLSRIVLSDAELTPLELTVLTGLSKSAVSRLIEHLERKELLQTKLYAPLYCQRNNGAGKDIPVLSGAYLSASKNPRRRKIRSLNKIH